MLNKKAGDIVVLRAGGSRKKARGAQTKQICRVWADFVCAHDGRVFTASVVAEYDGIKHSASGGVGRILTREGRRPKWCRPSCKAAARAAPVREKTCAGPGERHTFKTNNRNNIYCSPACREAEARARRRRQRPPSIPPFEVSVDPAVVARAIGGRAVEALDLRAAQEYEARLARDPDFAAFERKRKAEELAAGERAAQQERDRTAMLEGAGRVVAEDADREAMLEGAGRVVAEDADREAMLEGAGRVVAEDADREAMLEGAGRVVAEDADRTAMLAADRRFAPVVAAWSDDRPRLPWWQRL